MVFQMNIKNREGYCSPPFPSRENTVLRWQISTFCFVFKHKPKFKEIQPKHPVASLNTLPCVSKAFLRLLGLLILFSFKTKRTCLIQVARSFLVKHAAAQFFLRVLNSKYFTISTKFQVCNFFIDKTCFVHQSVLHLSFCKKFSFGKQPVQVSTKQVEMSLPKTTQFPSIWLRLAALFYSIVPMCH